MQQSNTNTNTLKIGDEVEILVGFDRGSTGKVEAFDNRELYLVRITKSSWRNYPICNSFFAWHLKKLNNSNSITQ